MNKYLQRIFLTALVALLGGVNAAWADTFEVLYGVPSYDTDGSTILSVAPQDDFTGDANELTGITHSDANGTNCTDAMPIDGSVLNLKADWTKDFSAPVTSGKVVFVANYTVSANNSKTIKIVDSNGYAIYESSVQTTNGNANQDVATICGTAVSNWVRQARSAHYGVKSLVIDLDARTVSYELIASSGNNSFSTLTGTVNIPAEVTDVKGMSVTKTNYDAYLDHVAFYSQVSAEVKYRYTVNYTYNDEVVRVIGGNVVAGTVINTERVIYGEADNTKYIVVAEELPTLTVTAEGDNILNVPVRLAVKYGYTVTSAYDGQALPFTATGEVWEDENTAKVSYPRYQLSGTQLVTKAPNGNDLQESITVASDGFTQVFDYTAVEGIDNICLLSEAEDLGTTLSSSATSFTTRVSNGQIIYGAKGDLLTLPAGKYIFTLGTIGGDSNSHQVNYELYKEATPTEEGAEHNADNKIGEGTCTGNTLKLIASDEFELTEETVISFTCSDAASTRGIDLVYVQKTGDVEPPFDITTVITNGDFEGEYTVYSNPSSDRAIYQPAGWTLTYENGEVNDMTALNSSCLSWNSFSGKPQPTNGDNNSYWVRFRWGNSEQLTLSQTVTLSAGEYRLTADAFFNGATGASATISAGDASTSITGNSTWANYAVDFTLNEDTDVTIALNVKQTSQVENIAAFDNFKINFLSDIVKALLQEEIAAAEALKTEARTEGLADFNAAIDAAKALLTSTDASAINAAVEALKQAEEAYLTANLPVAKGTYYVYNPLTKKFLSRGNAYGTAATVDDYGVAVNVAVSDLTAGNYTLSSFDIGANYGFDAWMYADAGGGNVRTYNINKVEGGVTLTNTNNSQLVYVYLKEDGNKYCVAGNATKDDNYTDDAQTVWQFLTKAERDELVAAREAAQKAAAFEAAEIAEDAEVTIADATTLNFGSNHGWTVTTVRTQGGQPSSEGTVTEMWQATGSFAKTVSDLPEGLYKVSIQAFYRDGNSDEDVARVATGYNTVLAYLEANGNKVQVKSWASDKGEGNDPNNKTQAQTKFNEGKYLSEVYTYVTEDGQLNLTVNNPAHIGNGWFIVGNVKYAKVDKKSAKPGDISGDGQVTTSDAVTVIDFILENSEPTEEQFKAADVNKDEVLTVSDAVGIVSIALELWDGVTTNGARPATTFDYANNYLVVDGADVALVNNTSFVGFQMDVTLSEGAQFNGAQLSQRTSGHQVAWNRVGDRTYRIVVFSMGNDAISSSEGTLLHLDITGNQQVSVVSNEFTDQQLQGYHLQLGDATGIHAIHADDADSRIFNAAGQQLDKMHKGMNVVVDRNGKTVKVLRK